MFSEKWSTFTTPLRNLQAAKRDVSIPCPDPLMGSVGSDHVSIEIPTYQRGLVWTPKHGEQFQEALQRGWPVGQLVLAERKPSPLPGTSGLMRIYQLIDGQQRTFWLNRTADNFFAEQEFSLDAPALSNAIARIAGGLGVTQQDVADSVNRWTALPNFKRSHLRDMQFLLHHLTSDLSVLPPSLGTDAYEHCSEGILEIDDAIATQYESLLEMPVPILLIRHELENDLHEIFQRLNEGARLSDLDLMAAEWQMISANVMDSKLDSNVKSTLISFAQSRISATYDQDAYEYDPDLVELNPAELSVFDLLFALGKYAAQKYPKTFEALGPSADRLAIFVAALVFAGGISRRKDLSSSYPDAQTVAGRDVDRFSDAFLLACQDLDGAFSRLNAVDAGKRLRGRVGLVQAATYLAAHIVTVAIVDRGSGSRLNLSIRQNNDDKRLFSNPTQILSPTQRRERFKAHLVGWFLTDTLSERFQGSDAYTEATNRVWRAFDPGSRLLQPSEEMLSPVNVDVLCAELARRFLREFDITSTPLRRRYSEPGCALLRVAYAYRSEVISAEELDHVVPFDAKSGRTFVVPINHTANLMPIQKTINAARRERYIPDFFLDPSVSASTKDNLRARLLIASSDSGSAVLHSHQVFREYLAERWKSLSCLALKSLGGVVVPTDQAAREIYEARVEPLLVETD